MHICCEQTTVTDQDIYIYKLAHQQKRQKILTQQSQVNPLLYDSDERILMFAKSKNQMTVQECEERKIKFTDIQFPAGPESVGKYEGRKIQWVRLSQIIQNVSQNRYNPIQILSLKDGDTYFLASLAALAQTPYVIDEVFEQQLKLNSVEAYKLNISLRGKPQQMIIDGYLPVFQDNHQRSAFSHIDPNYIWVVLFQKVYAKIKGSYQKISTGFAHQVLATFSMAPCLYTLIPTDFRHQEQEKLWNILQQCQRMHYATVMGSRKKFTCNAIVPHHSYCFKTCRVISNKEGEERKVYLWNVPGIKQNPQKGISYQENGDIISLSLVEFMRNFELIDVAHIRPHFSSHFYSFTLSPPFPIFYAFTTTQKASIYLTLQRQQGNKGRLRLILINCSNEAKYEYISGKKEEIFNDVTLHVQKLLVGSYIVLCESETDSSALLKVYSQKPIPLMKFTANKDNLIERALKQMAKNSHSEKSSLSKEHNDWYLSKILFEQLGLAFFAISLDQNSQLKCEINLSKKRLSLEDMKLINKNVKEGYSVILQKGQSDILIFEFIGENKESFSFPPSCMNIKVII